MWRAGRIFLFCLVFFKIFEIEEEEKPQSSPAQAGSSEGIRRTQRKRGRMEGEAIQILYRRLPVSLSIDLCK
jgi:hypothetical protein